MTSGQAGEGRGWPSPVPGFSLRAYRPSDSDACKRLEQEGSEFSQNFLLQGGFTHYKYFHAKPEQFGKYAILVCERDQDQRICAAIVAVVKQAHVHHKLQQCAYVFDLRVAAPFRRKGIARALTTTLHEICVAPPYNVEYFYLSANGTNKKARALYTSLGWSRASERRLRMCPTLIPSFASISNRTSNVIRLPTDDSIRLVADFYSARDLGLDYSGFQKLFASEGYLGTYFATDAEGSEASLSLWHGSLFTGFHISRFIFPAYIWSYIGFPVAIASAICLIFSLFHLAWKCQSLVVKLLLFAAGTVLSLFVTKMISWVHRLRQFRARAFAPVWRGDAEKWQHLMRAVYARVEEDARSRGFACLAINADINSPIWRALKRSFCSVGPAEGNGRCIAFWHTCQGLDCLPLLSPDCFFDPRDM